MGRRVDNSKYRSISYNCYCTAVFYHLNYSAVVFLFVHVSSENGLMYWKWHCVWQICKEIGSPYTVSGIEIFCTVCKVTKNLQLLTLTKLISVHVHCKLYSCYSKYNY